jgi:hypothetical protein
MFFYEILCELNVLEALEKTLIDITHYSDYNTYVQSLREDEVVNEERGDLEENNKKSKLKIGAIECLISILTVVPRMI